jgi:glycosyltransferase involved in cell wall biosynthesis
VVEACYNAICAVVDKEPLFAAFCTELIFIDDGSSDETLPILENIAASEQPPNRYVEYISFSRNFGKEAAILAGLQHATGDYIVLMDADLQHPPQMLIPMLNALLNEGFDCAGARRTSRKGEPAIRSFFSRLFYKIINKISGTEMVDGGTDFRMFTRQMLNAILELTERNRFSKGLFSWVGFKTKWIPYENVERAGGTTTWSFWSLLRYSLEGFLAFSVTPLLFSAVAGIIIFALSIILFLYFLFKAIFFGDPVAGFPTLITTVLFLGGLIMLSLGIISQYLAKTYVEIKRRPIYIVRRSSQAEKQNEHTHHKH